MCGGEREPVNLFTICERYEHPQHVSLAALLRERACVQPDAPAVFIDGGWLTYAALIEQTFRAANALAHRGIGPGDRVGALLPNTGAFLAVWLAAAELGATFVPVNINLTGETLRYIVQHADLSALVVDATLLASYAQAFGEDHPARLVIVAGDEDFSRPGMLNFARLLREAPPEPPPLLPILPEHPALIIYTSGTTGRPKGVVLSRAAQLAHGWYYGKDFVRVGPGEASYTCLPLFHVTSMGFTLGTLLGGGRIGIDARFNPFAFWERVRQFEARIFPYVGAMIGTLLGRPERDDDATNPAQRAIGSATPADMWEQFERRFGLTLIETYGQTELGSLWMMPPPEGARVGTVGKPAPRFRAIIADRDGQPLPPGEQGEILIQPFDPLLMTPGYFRDEATTAHAFRYPGWYATGDIGVQDTDGFFRFCGRLRDFIRRRGENVSAFEVERVALTHPAVREAAAVGVPSAVGEEEIKLCVVLHEGMAFDPDDLDRYLRRHLPRFMQPRYIQRYDAFPRTATQRVQKFRLVEDGVAEAWERRRRG